MKPMLLRRFDAGKLSSTSTLRYENVTLDVEGEL
jgi:hypothetical protein